MVRFVAAGLILWAGVAVAEDWRALNGADIALVLTDRTLDFAFGQQIFRADGTTTYFTPDPSHGRWRVTDDRYCSIWPPGESWACYDVLAQNQSVRFVDVTGYAEDGTLAD
jgi:hypothetical protein